MIIVEHQLQRKLFEL